MSEQTNEQWVASLTPQRCEEIIAKAIELRDFESAVTMLKILAVKDPYRAEAVMATINLGLEIARQRDRKDG